MKVIVLNAYKLYIELFNAQLSHLSKTDGCMILSGQTTRLQNVLQVFVRSRDHDELSVGIFLASDYTLYLPLFPLQTLSKMATTPSVVALR